MNIAIQKQKNKIERKPIININKYMQRISSFEFRSTEKSSQQQLSCFMNISPFRTLPNLLVLLVHVALLMTLQNKK